MLKRFMKQMTRISFFVLLLILPLTVQAQTSGTCGPDLTWILDDNGTLTVSGTGAMDDYSPSENPAPWGKEVKTAIFESGITYIGKNAFYYCAPLENVTIPSSVTKIGDNAFTGQLAGIKNVYVDSMESWLNLDIASTTGNPLSRSNLYIGGELLTNLIIPEGVTTLRPHAFSWCDSLVSVTLPDSLTTIGDNAFYTCRNLTSVFVPESVTSIGQFAFSTCSKLTDVTLQANITELARNTFSGCESLTSIDLPNSITRIGNFAFYNCSSLKSISLPDNLIILGNSVFSGCTLLSDLSLPDSITDIGDYAFSKCANLGKITIPKSMTEINEYTFNNCTGLTHLIIPGNLTDIGLCSFTNCTGLESITFNGSVRRISEYAFQGCTSLKSVTLPYGLNMLNGCAFYGCTSLTDVIIPNSVTNIGWECFNGCTNLTSLRLPANAANVDDWAFLNCPNVEEVSILGYQRPSYTLPPEIASATVYCYEFSEVDFWALENKYAVSYVPESTVLVKSFAFDADELWFVSKTEAQLSIVDIQPANAEISLTFSIGNSDIVSGTVSNLAISLKGLLPGDTTITATDKVTGISAKCILHVVYPVTQIAFANEETEISIGETASLTATVTCRDQTVINKLVTFASSDETIATVDANGIVTALRPGTVSITATADSGVSASCSLTVSCTGHVEEILPALDPTCTESGLTEGVKCSLCNTVLTEQTEIAALGHSCTESITAPATCLLPGEKTFTCSVCGDISTEEIPMLSHSEEILPALDPTCTESGLTEGVKCSLCNTVLTEQTEIAALGHTEGEKIVVIQPTHSAPGLERISCMVCGETVYEEEIPSLVVVTGDANGNGKTDILDILVLLRYVMGSDVPIDTENADVNGNGRIDFNDALLLMQYEAGWDVIL